MVSEGLRHRLAGVQLDEASVVRWSEDVQRERRAALCALLEENRFVLHSCPEGGPYHLFLSIMDGRLRLRLSDLGGHLLEEVPLSLAPFRNLVREYFTICEAYFTARRGAQASRIETLDMARRGLHNDGAALLTERLSRFIGLDTETARRLFTLVCVLHLKEQAPLKDSA